MHNYHCGCILILTLACTCAYDDQMALPYSEYLKRTKFVCGNVTSVSPNTNQVFVDSQDGDNVVLGYDYLIICTGTSYPHFKAVSHTLDGRKDELHHFAEEIANADHIFHNYNMYLIICSYIYIYIYSIHFDVFCRYSGGWWEIRWGGGCGGNY